MFYLWVSPGDTVTVSCTPGGDASPVLINGDAASCFLYSQKTGLPAPPLSLACAGTLE